MKRRLFILFLILVCGLAMLPAEAKSKNNISTEAYKKARVELDGSVLITPSGDKYHRPSCKFVRKDSKRISLKQAQSLGYIPCKICKP